MKSGMLRTAVKMSDEKHTAVCVGYARHIPDSEVTE